MSEASESECTNAPSDTLLGKLQRGLGRGYLDALAAPREEALACLVHCLLHDPRRDSDGETRHEYYAELACELELPLDAVEDYLRTTPGSDRSGPHTPVLRALHHMVLRGRLDAVRILRDYVGYGPELGELLYALYHDRPELLAGLDQVIAGRLDELEHLWLPEELRADWRTNHPRLGEHFAEANEYAAEHTAWRASLPDYGAMPLAEALAAAVDHGRFRAVVDAWRDKVRPEDAPVLLAALDPEQDHRSRAALRCMRDIVGADLIDPLAEFVERTADTALAFEAGRKLEYLDHPRVLELGLRWYGDTRMRVRWIGEGILIRQATVHELPLIRSALAADWRTDEGWRAVRVGLRMAENLSCPELLPAIESLYHELDDSYERLDAVGAMIANAPEVFAERYAYECLWDCDLHTREAAIYEVRLTPEALVRLRAIADDASRHRREREAVVWRMYPEEAAEVDDAP